MKKKKCFAQLAYLMDLIMRQNKNIQPETAATIIIAAGNTGIIKKDDYQPKCEDKTKDELMKETFEDLLLAAALLSNKNVENKTKEIISSDHDKASKKFKEIVISESEKGIGKILAEYITFEGDNTQLLIQAMLLTLLYYNINKN